MDVYIRAMQGNRILEQHIAVFGESGSGKTVMASSFYGTTQERQFWKSNPFRVVADDIGQGSELHKMYLDMRDEAIAPLLTKFRSTSYSFSLKMTIDDPTANADRPYDAMRLVWHDYPGEWFEQAATGPEEEQRRIDTFRSLLSSDVALVLVDGQKLLANKGEEERYLKSLFGNLRNALLNLKDDLLIDGAPLVKFPRIWMLVLSKADLFPDMNVVDFRDLVIKKATDDLAELRKVLGSMVESKEAMSVGEDFLLLSSAKFEANRIEVAERVGLDLVLPIAAVLPFQRQVRWIENKMLGTKVLQTLADSVDSVAAALLGRGLLAKSKGKGADTAKVAGASKAAGRAKGAVKGGLKALDVRAMVMDMIRREVLGKAVSAAAKLAGDKLRAKHAEALAKRDYMAAVLTGFQIALDENEERDERPVLLRSQK
jgi:hypothetical protein